MLIFECLKVSRHSCAHARVTLTLVILKVLVYDFVSATCWMRMNLFVNLDQQQFEHMDSLGDRRRVTGILMYDYDS